MEVVVEIWKPIYINNEESNYMVSTYGRIKNKKTGKIMKLSFDNYGYLKISLKHRGISITRTVHRLVMETFNPNPDKTKQVNHINGIKTDNRLENLEWVTVSENIKHAFSLGLKKPRKGEESNFNKYNEEIIRFACELMAQGKGTKYISEKTGLPYKYITDIRTGKKWAHISKDYNLHKLREKKFKGFDRETKEKIRALIKRGFKPKEICIILGIEYNKTIKIAITNLRKTCKLGE